MEKNAKPFFAKFLENQLQESETQQVKGGGKLPVATTNAYPCDKAEVPVPTILRDEFATTMKYPSDSDDDVVFTDL